MDLKSDTQKVTGGSKPRRSVWRKLVLLMWKNLLLRQRHWLLTAFEILLPTLLCTMLVTIKVLPDSSFLPHYVDQNSTFNASSEESLKEILCKEYGEWVGNSCHSPWLPFIPPGQRKIFYGPPNNFTAGVASHLADKLGITRRVLSAVSTNEEMDIMVDKSYYEADSALPTFYVGLYFDNVDGDVPPQNLSYSLRLPGYWFTELVYPFLQIPGPRNFSVFGGLHGGYNMDGFTLIQSIVDRYYITLLANNNTDYTTQYQLETQMYPYPPYVQDNGISQLYGSLLPTVVVLSLVLLSPSLIKSVVHEKETGVRELIRLMGLNGWLVWLGWFLYSFIIILLVSSIMTFLLKVELMPTNDGSGYLPPILAYSDPFFVWVLLMLYGISSIVFCFAISTFFSKPTLATTLGILLWLCSYFIPSAVMYDYSNESLAAKLLSCLLPNMAITWAFKVMSMFEGRTIGIQWDNLWDTGNPRDELTPAMILLMLVFDTLLYLLLVWYVDQVSPGKYGVPLPFYFPLQRSYWCGSRLKAVASAASDTDDETRQYFEEEPEGLRPGIVVRNLRKEFRTLGGKVKVAVEDVSMTCYEGQCTVLLGHNGAGKTTTMSVLTGVYAPSGGQAEVGGWNIATHLREAREELGLCPQHNMLFVDLTVIQHLLFFGRLKGLTTRAAREEAVALLERLDLMDKKNMFGNQLSGGMKRKLSLAISLIGGSKVVILDEPSSGLDPESRRWVWDVVQGERGRRTVLVTTHHMEEADVLGDRVAIMASGRVVCAGSTLFLKNKFGDGYTLNLLVSENCDSQRLAEACKKLLPSVVLHRSQGNEFSASLPPDTTRFVPLLEGLSSDKEELGLRHIGLSLTTMEKVFLKVGDINSGETHVESKQESNPGSENGSSVNGLNAITPISSSDDKLHDSQRHLVSNRNLAKGHLTGKRLLAQRMKGFLVKRLIYFQRKWLLLVSQALLPVLVTVGCLLMDASLSSTTSHQPPRELSLTMFPFSQSYVTSDPGLGDLADAYESFFWGPYKVNSTDNMDATLLKEGEEDILTYRENNICSAEFLDAGSGVTAMRMRYQSIPIHSPGVSTSIITNALLRLATNSTDYSITTTNYPLASNSKLKMNQDYSSTSSLVYSMLMPLALALLSASFLVFPLQERETKAKQVQVMTGAPLWVLWLATFLWDYCTYLVSSLLIFAAFMIGDSQEYFTVDAAPGALILLLLLYGWGSIPLAYVFSFFFQTAAAGFSVMTLINIVAGMIITTAVSALDMSEQPSLLVASDVLHWIASLLPAYPASLGFQHLVNTTDFNARCDVFNETLKLELCDTLYLLNPYDSFMPCCPECANHGQEICFQKRSYFVFDEYGMSRDMLTLTINGFIFFAILCLIDAGVFRKLGVLLRGLCKKAATSHDLEVSADDDVLAEAALVEQLMTGAPLHPPREASLVVSSLSKTFVGAKRPAVNKISFHVGRGECLGLLGVNGAGKTTTFNMLTGDEVPTTGDARTGSTSLGANTGKFVQKIGYCPQFDAILGELTGEEMLTLMGRLRGISDSSIPASVSKLVHLLGLTECAQRPSSTYSGGNRRKLSTAMALIGEPPLVFLDEPTSGVDPASRRRMWEAISQAVSGGQSVLLTSHSMEECEALCSRIIIMSRGTLRCVGTSGHLKAKFGQGYSLQVKLRTHDPRLEDELQYTARVVQLKATIQHRLSGAVLTDQHKGMLAFRISKQVSWGHLFSVMESMKNGHEAASGGDGDPIVEEPLVEDYAASDASLEQVFLSFAREATPDPPKHSKTVP